jgi:TonB-linked SusC/RagA family outer membrane protein
MSEEKWMKQFKWLDEFKVRASVGLTGNDGIPDFQSLGLYGGNANYGGQSGIYPSQLPNDNLKWETTTQRNIGLDFSFLKERFGITIDIYSNKTKDLLLDRPVSLTSGYASIMDNIGELENKGFEFTLTSQNLRKAVKWSTNLNFSVARNKVTKLYNDQPIIISSWGNSRIVVGEPIGIFWAHNSLGVDPSSGDIVFEDVNNDGLITADDMKKVGSPHPDFTSGMTNTFEYGNWEMSIFLHLVYGNEVYNSPRMWIEAMKGSDNQTTEIIRRWRQPGDITDIPRVTETDPNNNNRPSSRFIEDGSFLRVKNVSVSYRFNPDILKKIHVSYARVYVSVQNLFTFTKYTGMDPEVNYAGTDNLVLGTDFFTFPQARGFTAGLNLRF